MGQAAIVAVRVVSAEDHWGVVIIAGSKTVEGGLGSCHGHCQCQRKQGQSNKVHLDRFSEIRLEMFIFLEISQIDPF